MNSAVSAADARRTLRKAMPIVESAGYFDHAAVAPLSGPAADRMQRYAADLAHSGDLVWPDYAGEIEQCRQTAARMLNAAMDEIAWIANTTQGINFVAGGLDWRAGDNLVTLSNEFPSNIYPWLQLESAGVETRMVEPDEGGGWSADSLLAVCDERTRLISVSWVGFSSGFRGPVGALVDAAHARGIRVFLDAIQGMGVFPLDVRRTPVDFLAADGHKWMLGPEGAGILYVSGEALNLLRPMNVGWNSVVDRYDFTQLNSTLRASAARYEGGTQNVPGIVALGASLSLLEHCGHGPSQSAVGDAVLENTALLAERLRGFGADVQRPPGGADASAAAAGIVRFSVPGKDPDNLRQACATRRVAVSCRNGWLRASPHAYMNEDDVALLLEALEAG